MKAECESMCLAFKDILVPTTELAKGANLALMHDLPQEIIAKVLAVFAKKFVWNSLLSAKECHDLTKRDMVIRCATPSFDFRVQVKVSVCEGDTTISPFQDSNVFPERQLHREVGPHAFKRSIATPKGESLFDPTNKFDDVAL